MSQPIRVALSFPATVNEHSARQVATGVVILTVGYAITSWGWLMAAIAFGFIARVLAGPTMSPLAQIVTRVVTPTTERLTGRAGPVVAGTPKRFAQAIGATLSLAALTLHAMGLGQAATAVALMITGAALLESVLGYCLGCRLFAKLMTVGLIPATVCVECSDITKRLATAQLSS